MRIESIRLRNFKMFRGVLIEALPKVCYFVGANGTGKSTLFDVFGFLRDCLTHNVKIALDRRGGYHEVRTRNAEGGIEIELKFRMEIVEVQRLVTYILKIGNDESDSPCIEREILRYKRGTHGSPYHFIDFRHGQGEAITNEEDFKVPDTQLERETQSVDPSVPAIKGLGQFQRFKAAFAFRNFIEKWHVSDFHISAARPSGEAAYHEHLSEHGENLGAVTKYLQEKHGSTFEDIQQKMSLYVPGIKSIGADTLADGRILLKFGDSAYKEPFVARHVSDGTIKMFAYLVLLNDPKPHPLLCIEEPENQLYHSLMKNLVGEFQEYATRGNGQVMVSTHSPHVLNAAHIDEVFWLTKNKGETHVRRANRSPLIVTMTKSGELPGELWASNFFEGAHPDE